MAATDGAASPSGVMSPLTSYNQRDSSISQSTAMKQLEHYLERDHKSMVELGNFMYDAQCRGTFLFFGSARTQCHADFNATVAKLRDSAEKLEAAGDVEGAKKVRARLVQTERRAWACDAWELTKETAKQLTEWAMSDEGRNVGLRCKSKFPSTPAMRSGDVAPLIVCTGGGPGFMEAGNAGAAAVPNGRSMGVGIVLPFETKLNDFVTPGLGIDAEFFYSRKYWEVFSAKAVILAPGGVGTLDELFEVLTLLQCEKMQELPVVLLGKSFWDSAINLRFCADKGMMSHEEIDRILVTDSAAEAVEFIRKFLMDEAAKNISPTKRGRDHSVQ